MNRRKFLYASGTIAGGYLLGPSILVRNVKINPMARIGMTTVTFRSRFRATQTGALSNELKLTDIPGYYSQRFGIRNIEFWTPHFESMELSYLKDVKSALTVNKCTLINIQVDTPPYDVSDPDNQKREAGISRMKEWIDAGQYLGTKMIRVSSMSKSYDNALGSVRLLAEYANNRGITLLVENHNDQFSNPDNHVRIAWEFSNRQFGLIADFGNYPDKTDRYAALKMIAPYTKLVSAKTMSFDENYNHTSFDFDKCIKTMEEGGYKGIYSLEQWTAGSGKFDYERIADWMIEHVKANI